MEKYKLLPYGISNYAQVKREGLLMVDKTMYLERLERAGNFLFLIRSSSLRQESLPVSL